MTYVDDFARTKGHASFPSPSPRLSARRRHLHRRCVALGFRICRVCHLVDVPLASRCLLLGHTLSSEPEKNAFPSRNHLATIRSTGDVFPKHLRSLEMPNLPWAPTPCQRLSQGLGSSSYFASFGSCIDIFNASRLILKIFLLGNEVSYQKQVLSALGKGSQQL